ncbi:MAG: outer membrane beta-barrel protein [Bacteroidota bacterium]|nr:outer membrane beta-barrel protein [Bacteroidota bacterium]
MKKIIILTISIILFQFSYSQNHFGLTAGSNFSYLTTDSSSLPIKYGKPGPYGGIFWNITNGYNSYVEVGAYYSLQGAQFKSENFVNNTDSLKTEKYTFTINSNIHYLKIPVVWKKTYGDWYTKLGFYGEIALLKTSKWEKNHLFLDTNYSETGTYGSFAENLRVYDMGLTMALGVQFSITNNIDFFLNFEYNLGFLNLTPNEIVQQNKMYNRFFTISTGIIFNKTKYKYR